MADPISCSLLYYRSLNNQAQVDNTRFISKQMYQFESSYYMTFRLHTVCKVLLVNEYLTYVQFNSLELV